MKQEFNVKPLSGYLAVLAAVLLISGTFVAFYNEIVWLGVVMTILTVLTLIGFTIVEPNGSCVMVLFGAYSGTIRDNGFFWVNPFYLKRKISLRARNFDSEPIKVNDKLGNPIKIGFVLVWRVAETYKAVFEVDDYQHFVLVQSDAALRKLAGLYPYDNLEDHEAVMTLRSGGEEVMMNWKRKYVNG
jgi:regulator of protease activity HflC (stomatin/prohibitin superfamily)